MPPTRAEARERELAAVKREVARLTHERDALVSACKVITRLAAPYVGNGRKHEPRR